MKHKSEYRVYYEDTDAGGVVYYANYFKFAERGRTELLRATGFENSSIGETYGAGFVVRRLSADYIRPARLDDLLTVETDVETVKNSSFVMRQSIFCHNDLVFSLEVTLACIGRDFRPRRIPDDIKRALEGS